MAVAELASSPLEGILRTPFTSSVDLIQTTVILLSVACLIGLVTAIYPATFMSSVSAVSVLNKTAKAVRSGPLFEGIDGYSVWRDVGICVLYNHYL